MPLGTAGLIHSVYITNETSYNLNNTTQALGIHLIFNISTKDIPWGLSKLLQVTFWGLSSEQNDISSIKYGLIITTTPTEYDTSLLIFIIYSETTFKFMKCETLPGVR